VTDMGYLFCDCPRLKTVYVGETWSTSSVGSGTGPNGASMFEGCRSIVGGNGTRYSDENTGVDFARVDTPRKPGYLSAAGRVPPYVRGARLF